MTADYSFAIMKHNHVAKHIYDKGSLNYSLDSPPFKLPSTNEKIMKIKCRTCRSFVFCREIRDALVIAKEKK
jgi:hypothetical protein